MALHTRSSVTVAARETPQATIAALARQFAGRAAAFERVRDARCVFARAYASLSHVLARSVEHAGFSDPAWVTRLAVVFSEYYLRALDERDEGRLAPGAWTIVFDASEHGRTSVLEELVLGMTAHIVNDLPQALCDVGLSTPGGVSRIGDYHLLNDVLGQAIGTIQQELSARYDPWLGLLDRVFEGYDEILTNYGLRIARAAAWYNAHRLLDPASREAAKTAIAHSPEVTLRELLDPPSVSLRFIFRGARLLARSTRRWPDQQTAHGDQSHVD